MAGPSAGLSILLAGLSAPAASAAALPDAVRSDLERGVAAAAAKTSDQPALRAERQLREPSPAFRLGAALGAWRNAADGLDYDLKTPSGDGDDSAAIRADCDDERTAFADLEAARGELSLPDLSAAVADVHLPATLADRWRARRLAHPAACGR